MGSWAAHFWDNRKSPCLPSSTLKKVHDYFYHLSPIFWISTTQTPAQIKSQEFIGLIKQHSMTTSPPTCVANGIQYFVKCCIKNWVHLDLRPNIFLDFYKVNIDHVTFFVYYIWQKDLFSPVIVFLNKPHTVCIIDPTADSVLLHYTSTTIIINVHRTQCL